MNKDIVTNLKLLFDSEFYYKLLLFFVEIKDSSIMSLLSSSFIRQFAVFIHEMSVYVNAEILSGTSNLFQNTNEIIRNRVHYFSNKPFAYLTEKTAVDEMIYQIQSAFLTRPKDNLYAFRHDISYIKVKDKLIYSNVEIYSLLTGTPLERKGQIEGQAIRQYCTDVASVISSFKKGFSDTEIGSLIFLENFKFAPEFSTIQFFDAKFDDAVQKSGFSNHMTTILLKMLSDVGVLLYFINDLLDPCWVDTFHLYFLTRQIAIRFDEISDAIYQIGKHFPKTESAVFIRTLEAKRIYPFPEKLRHVAKKPCGKKA